MRMNDKFMNDKRIAASIILKNAYYCMSSFKCDVSFCFGLRTKLQLNGKQCGKEILMC